MLDKIIKEMLDILNDDIFTKEEKEEMSYAYNMLIKQITNRNIRLGKKQGKWTSIEKEIIYNLDGINVNIIDEFEYEGDAWVTVVPKDFISISREVPKSRLTIVRN